MQKITIIGQILDSSGYSRHTRELANALNKITEVSLQTSLTPGWERQVNDAELQMIKRETDNEINLIITNPLFWRINLTAKRNWVYLIWEGDKVPKWMINECTNKNIEKIIVPSKHTYQAITVAIRGIEDDTGEERHDLRNIKDKLEVIPHGVDLDKFHPIPTNKSDTFKFLAVKGFTNMEDRGGVQFAIQSFLQEFTNKDNVELIIKLNTCYGTPDFNKLFPDLKNKDNPKITLITDTLDDKQLNQLYNDSNVFVSPTRAESFNLPVLESLATGTPTIVTNYGGQTDFVDIECGWLIPYTLSEVTWDLNYEGIKWAKPNIKKLSCAMRFTYENPKIVKAMSSRAVSMAKCLTWDKTAQMINNLK